MTDTSRRGFITKSALAGLTVPLAISGLTKNSHDYFLLPHNATLKPARLIKGDTVAVSSPAGAVWDEKRLAEFIRLLEDGGFKVITGKTLTQKKGYLSGTDEERAHELNSFFADQNVKAILSAKGGWGCARMLEHLDYDLIQKNPKIIMGFSDLTSLLNAIYARTGLVTFHGPVGNSSWGEFSMTYFSKVLMQAERVLFEPYNSGQDIPVTIFSGKTKGVLAGGNLTVLSAIMGSNYVPHWKNKILFLEETAEEPYRIDRMLTQLKLNGVLDQVNGVVFGKCVKCEAEEPDKAFTFMEVIEQHLKPLGKPAFYGAMIGHIENKFTLPIGIEVEMDADKGTMLMMETAVI